MLKTITAVLIAAAALWLGAAPAAARPTASLSDAIRAEYGLTDPWYAKYRDVGGIPVVGSATVDDATLARAVRTTRHMLAALPRGTKARLKRAGMRIVIVGRGERVSHVPGVAARLGPDTDVRYWAGFGATPDNPLCVATESNLADGFGDENLLVYALATSVAELGLKPARPAFVRDLDAAYARALADGRWSNSYARASANTYWAEGVQSYFNANREGPKHGDGVHGRVNTRAELRRHDPRLYRLIEGVFGDVKL